MSVLNAPNPYETVVMDRRNASAGFDSIGAVATQKHESDALNLGFPSAYASVYSRHARVRPQYLEQAPMREAVPYVGNDLQFDVHQQRKRDADYMAGQKVRSTQISRVRYVGTAHGRGFQPHAQLGQRVYANPSTGAYIPYSSRRDYTSAPFHLMEGAHGSGLSGGVLRSPQGVAFGRRVLQNRIQQLDAIQSARQAFSGTMAPAGMPGVVAPSAEASTASIPSVGESSAIELNLLLDGLINNLMAGSSGAEGLTRFTYADATRALLLIFRLAPIAPPDFFEDLMGKVSSIINLLGGALEADETGNTTAKEVEGNETALSLMVLFEKLREYLTRMISGAPVNRTEMKFNPLTGTNEPIQILSQQQGQNLSPKERVALSKALVADLGFSKLLKTTSARQRLKEAYQDKEMNPAEAQRYREGDVDYSDEDDDEDGADDDRFDHSARPREDEEHATETGVSRGSRNFDVDERGAFGRQQYGIGIRPTYFGEEQNEGIEEEEGIANLESGGLGFNPNAYAESPDTPKRKLPENVLPRGERLLPASVTEISGFFDPDTQAFNVGNTGAQRLRSILQRRGEETPSSKSSVSLRSPIKRRTAADIPANRELVQEELKAQDEGTRFMKLNGQIYERGSDGKFQPVNRSLTPTEFFAVKDLDVVQNRLRAERVASMLKQATPKKPRTVSTALATPVASVGEPVKAPSVRATSEKARASTPTARSVTREPTPADSRRAVDAGRVQQAKAILLPYGGQLPRSNARGAEKKLKEIGDALIAKGLITAPRSDPTYETKSYRTSLQNKLKALGFFQ